MAKPDAREQVRLAAESLNVEVGQVYEHIGSVIYNARHPDDRMPASNMHIRIVQVAGERRARTTRYVWVDKPAGGNGRRDRQSYAITAHRLARGWRLVESEGT